jgi:hypothetical protein
VAILATESQAPGKASHQEHATADGNESEHAPTDLVDGAPDFGRTYPADQVNKKSDPAGCE